MGKRFSTDVSRLQATVEAAAGIDITVLVAILNDLAGSNLVAVGSGGSLTTAALTALLHENSVSRQAKAVSPLEAVLRAPLWDEAALLLSARGTNPDVIRAFHALRSSGCPMIGALCASQGSPLAREMRRSHCPDIFEFVVLAGRDGFLATKSLLAISTLLVRAYQQLVDESPLRFDGIGEPPDWHTIGSTERELLEVAIQRDTIIVLSAGWGWPAAIDFESKFSESALGHVLISDFRNFAHGRHHWLARRGAQTSVITLETPEVTPVASRTLAALPEGIATFRLSTPMEEGLGTLDLLSQLLFLVQVAGEVSSYDPGRAAVPTFGRRLYWSRMPLPKQTPIRAIWMNRKTEALGLRRAYAPQARAALDLYLRRLRRTTFRGLLADYDGTLCGSVERFTQPSREIGAELGRLLRAGVLLGIATGRGKSVHRALQELIPRALWDKVIVGLYNGAVVRSLTDSVDDLTNADLHDSLRRVAVELEGLVEALPVKFESRPDQITLTPSLAGDIEQLRRAVAEIVFDLRDVRVVCSSHSVDVLSPRASKLNVLREMRQQLGSSCGDDSILVIGDRGDWGGNDFELLSKPSSLSVDRVSARLDCCWNLSPPACKGPAAALRYLKALEPGKEPGAFRINIAELERVNAGKKK